MVCSGIGASIGAVFGPGGVIAGCIIGAVIGFMASHIYLQHQEKKNEASVSNNRSSFFGGGVARISIDEDIEVEEVEVKSPQGPQ